MQAAMTTPTSNGQFEQVDLNLAVHNTEASVPDEGRLAGQVRREVLTGARRLQTVEISVFTTHHLF